MPPRSCLSPRATRIAKRADGYFTGQSAQTFQGQGAPKQDMQLLPRLDCARVHLPRSNPHLYGSVSVQISRRGTLNLRTHADNPFAPTDNRGAPEPLSIRSPQNYNDRERDRGPRSGAYRSDGQRSAGGGGTALQHDILVDMCSVVLRTSTQCRTCARCSWTRGEGSNPSPPSPPPSWGTKLFDIFDASTQGVPPSYPLSHPISFLPPIPPPSLPFPPSIVDCTRHAPADGPLCSVCPQGGGRASCAP